MDRSREIAVFNDTLVQLNSKYKDATEKSMKNTVVYDEDELLLIDSNIKGKMQINFDANGTLTSARKLVDDGYRVAVLNFADAVKPCGWVEFGAPTQEENITRCSSLFYALTQKECIDRYYRQHEEDGIYSDTIIYTKDAIVFKDDVNYMNITPYYIDIITSPSMSRRDNPMFDDEQCYLTLKPRAEKIILSALHNGCDAIVLGAWGCGAFGMNPKVISRCFAEALMKYPYFDNVTFAIKPCFGNYDASNFDEFKKGFDECYNGN